MITPEDNSELCEKDLIFACKICAQFHSNACVKMGGSIKALRGNRLINVLSRIQPNPVTNRIRIGVLFDGQPPYRPEELRGGWRRTIITYDRRGPAPRCA
jgi:hypothetical protein